MKKYIILISLALLTLKGIVTKDMRAPIPLSFTMTCLCRSTLDYAL